MTAYLYLIISAISLAVMSILRKEYDKRNPKGVTTGVVFAGIAYAVVFIVSALVSGLWNGFSGYAGLDGFIVSIGFG